MSRRGDGEAIRNGRGNALILLSLIGVLSLGCATRKIGSQTALYQLPQNEAEDTDEKLAQIAGAIRPVFRIELENPDQPKTLGNQNSGEPSTTESLESRVGEHPGDPSLRKELVNAYAAEQRYADCLTVLAGLSQRSPEDPSVELALARIWFYLGDYAEALEHAQLSLDLEDSTEALALAGKALLSGGQVESALPMLREAARRDPSDSSNLAALGRALLKAEDWKSARQHLEIAVELDPSLIQAVGDLAYVLARLGEYEESLRRYQELSPGADAFNQLGLTLLSQGRWQEAQTFFRRALALEPDHVDARFNLSEAESYAPLPPVVTISTSRNPDQPFDLDPDAEKRGPKDRQDD